MSRKDDEAQAMHDAHMAGASLTEVGRPYGRTPSHVRRMFERRSWPVRNRHLVDRELPAKDVRRIADPSRFWSKVQPEGDGGVDNCWLWVGQLNANGYGVFKTGGPGSATGAHRVAYELMVDNIPEGLQIDHLCRTTSCVNPWHLEPVTAQVNVARSTAGSAARARQQAKTHCPKGHEYTEANVLVKKTNYGGTSRGCRACNNAGVARRRARRGLRSGE